MLTINEKVSLLDKLKAGNSYASVALQYGLNESTVRYIKKEEKNIRKTAAIYFPKDAKRVVNTQNKTMVRMENALAIWIHDCREKKITLDTKMIRSKAKTLFDAMVPEGGDDDNIQDEEEDDGDEDDPLPSTSSQTSPRRPRTTLVASNGWFDKFKRRFGLQRFMLKPGLIYKSQNPQALKNKNKALLPVYWMANKRAWITKALTLDWFLNSFMLQVKVYMAERGLPFKVVLFMDCAGGHTTTLHYEGVHVEFLPLNTTSHIQPMDHGVIRAFKALYTKSTMEGLISSIEETNETFSIKAYWKDYNIATCLANIQNALKDMKEQTLIPSWKKLLARLVQTEGFSDMTADEINNLIDCRSIPLTEEDLQEMTKSASEEEDESASDEGDEAEEGGLTLHNLQDLFNVAKDLQKRAKEMDDNMVRAVEFSNPTTPPPIATTPPPASITTPPAATTPPPAASASSAASSEEHVYDPSPSVSTTQSSSVLRSTSPSASRSPSPLTPALSSPRPTEMQSRKRKRGKLNPEEGKRHLWENFKDADKATFKNIELMELKSSLVSF
ncbi:tigger transposable element-derived protein 1-like [Palaemon carinicauda]|uniref:tigger transposable element-derived protein 1-like n=1 Tax=Palaemon carinicauda TaxID=392227 RepID=UPI0035B6AB29